MTMSAMENLRAPADGQAPAPRTIGLAHGGGGQLTDDLIAQAVLPRLGNSALNQLLDSAIVDAGQERIALTIDSYVVQPLFFPGGDIGRLAVSGTINDLCVSGARPLGIALGLILAEGLDQSILEKVLDSIAAASRESLVKIITGDTKVVPRQHADQIYIATAGVGLADRRLQLHPDRIQPGDRVLLSGTIADHGLAVMLAREMPDVKSGLKSDVAPLNGLIRDVLAATPDVVFMRDPTRGGLSAVAADLARRTGWQILLEETQIPIRPETLHAAELLGLDPLEVANEGKSSLSCGRRARKRRWRQCESTLWAPMRPLSASSGASAMDCVN